MEFGREVNGVAVVTPPSCGGCIFFTANPVDPKNLAMKVRGGMCKRLPPTPILLTGQDATGQIVQTLQSFFPPVPNDGFCHEFDDGVEVEEGDA